MTSPVPDQISRAIENHKQVLKFIEHLHGMTDSLAADVQDHPPETHPEAYTGREMLELASLARDGCNGVLSFLLKPALEEARILAEALPFQEGE